MCWIAGPCIAVAERQWHAECSKFFVEFPRGAVNPPAWHEHNALRSARPAESRAQTRRWLQVAPGKTSRGFYGLRYLSIVAAATIGLGIVAWIMQDRQLALAAGVMGLYALHLISIRYILDNQQEHSTALQSQWELLQRLVDPAEPIDVGDAVRSDGDAADVERQLGQIEAHGNGDADLRSWPPLSLPLTTIESGSELAIPPGLEMPGIPTSSAEPAARGRLRPESDRAVPEVRPAGGRPQPAEVPIPRHFALGTVALIRELLTPAEVARVLMEQRRQPDKRFATLAVEMGLLEDTQREELLLAQQEGLFTEDEMRRAREGLRQFRESTARALSDLG